MVVNGVEKTIEDGLPLLRFLSSEGYEAGRVAVEKNGVIVRKGDFESVKLQGSDRLEVVTFVGGG